MIIWELIFPSWHQPLANFSYFSWKGSLTVNFLLKLRLNKISQASQAGNKNKSKHPKHSSLSLQLYRRSLQPNWVLSSSFWLLCLKSEIISFSMHKQREISRRYGRHKIALANMARTYSNVANFIAICKVSMSSSVLSVHPQPPTSLVRTRIENEILVLAFRDN